MGETGKVASIGPTTGAVIERRRRTKKKRAAVQYQDGHQAGQAWARRDAAARHLEKLVEGSPNFTDWDSWLDVLDNGLNPGVAVGLFHDITRNLEAERWEIEQFWEDALGSGGMTRVADHFFALGFIEGATEVWEAVADKLDE
jgi:hypothetical protein